MYRVWPIRRSVIRALLALGAALCAGAQMGPGQSLAITNVTVIDVVTGRLQPDVNVVIQGDRIAGIGAIAIPRGAARIDGKGKFLIPGLWDMHAHHQGT